MASSKKNVPIHMGMQIAQCLTAILTGRLRVSQIIAVCNAILRLKVKLAQNKFAVITISEEGGLIVDLTRIAASGTSGSGNMNFVGEYNPANGPFSAFDVTVVTGGVSAGTYISLMDDNDQPPTNSIFWKQLANNNASGNWI